jgi:hypothetical protein
MRFYRNRASEFELLAEAEPVPEARLRYRIIARNYRELADRDERSDKASMAETLEQLKLKRTISTTSEKQAARWIAAFIAAHASRDPPRLVGYC